MIILAYSKISWGSYLVPVQKSATSVSFVFDISNSMLAKDGYNGTTRLESSAVYAKKLLEKMENNSVSVVIAKGDGVVAIPITEDKIYFLPDASMQQAKVYILIDGKPYAAKDAVNYMAFNEYFGGGFSGLVMNEIREKRSMAYNAYGHFSRPAKQGQMTKFTGYVGTQSDKVIDAVGVYMSLLDSMPQYPETIENIRTILRQSILSNKPTFRTKSQRLTANMLMGYKVDPAMLQVRDIQRLTFDNILSFYQSHVQGKPMTILIMGDPKLIDQKQLKAKYGKITKLSKSRLFSN